MGQQQASHLKCVVVILVLDTNTVLMPITRATNSDTWLREAWEQLYFIPLISDDTESEIIRTLRNRRFGLEPGQIPAAAAIYLDYCERVAISEWPPETPVCRDPDDQPFLILAYQAEADFLVTRDDDLLVLKDESEIPIVTPSQLRVILHQQL